MVDKVKDKEAHWLTFFLSALSEKSRKNNPNHLITIDSTFEMSTIIIKAKIKVIVFSIDI